MSVSSFGLVPRSSLLIRNDGKRGGKADDAATASAISSLCARVTEHATVVGNTPGGDASSRNTVIPSPLNETRLPEFIPVARILRRRNLPGIPLMVLRPSVLNNARY